MCWTNFVFLLLYFVKKKKKRRRVETGQSSCLCGIRGQLCSLIESKQYLSMTIWLLMQMKGAGLSDTVWWTWHGQNWLIWWERATPTCPLSGLWLIYGPPASCDPHLPTTHGEPPPCSSSPSLCIPVILLSLPLHVWCNPLPTQSASFLPFRHKGSVSAAAEERGAGGRFGRGWGRRRECILDVPIPRGDTRMINTR